MASISSIDCGDSSFSKEAGVEIVWFSSDHSPRSISWQRFEQNGLNFDAGSQSTSFWQVGHFTAVGIVKITIVNIFR